MKQNKKEDIISQIFNGDLIDVRQTKEFLEYGFQIVTCPICQNETLDDFFMCQHCGWEYDGTTEDSDYSSANKATVGEYRDKCKK